MRWPGMYRVMTLSLFALLALAMVGSALGQVGFSPAGIAVTAFLGIAATVGTSALGALIRRAPVQLESSVITGLLIAMIVPPTLEARDLIGVSAAGALAGASKWLIAPGGRHLLNPAATGVLVASLFGLTVGFWWIATPFVTPLILVLGAVVAYRSGHGRTVAVFLVIALALLVGRLVIAGEPVSETLVLSVTTYPLVFMGLFMVSEPLTQPTRWFDAVVTATVMAVAAALPFSLGPISSSPELALILGNLAAAGLTALRAVRRASWVTLHSTHPLSDSVVEYRFRSDRPVEIEPGQWVELQFPHRSDGRGERRVMTASRISINPDADGWSFAVTTRHSSPGSTWKKALQRAQVGDRFRLVQIGGDFFPSHALVGTMVMVAKGVGITPFHAMVDTAHQRSVLLEATLLVVGSGPESLYPELGDIRGVRRITVESVDQLHQHLPDDPVTWTGVSGSPEFVREARRQLAAAGVTKVETDRFIGY